MSKLQRGKCILKIKMQGLCQDEIGRAVYVEDEIGFLLCSDGLHGQVSNKEIAKIILNDGTESASSLISKANANGGKDNVSVIIIKIKG